MTNRSTPDKLLASAVEILTSGRNTFELKPWREIMAKNQAAADKAKEVKAASKRVAARVKPYKHEGAAEEGVDTTTEAVVNSGFSAFNPGSHSTNQDTNMTSDDTPVNNTDDTEASAGTEQAAVVVPQATLDKEAAAKAKIAAKEAKIKAAAAKEAKAKERAAAAEEVAKAAAARAEERKQKANETAEQHAARIAELTASGRTYVGSMLALADRVKQGVYTKSLTGQLRSSDELALALDAVPVENVIKLGIEALELLGNPYLALNVGQQSMNLRNRMRGAIKAGKLTLDKVKEIRDTNGYATAEAEVAEKRAKADARKQAAEAAKRLKAEAAEKAAIAKAEKVKAGADAETKAVEQEPAAA